MAEIMVLIQGSTGLTPDKARRRSGIANHRTSSDTTIVADEEDVKYEQDLLQAQPYFVLPQHWRGR